MSGLFTLDEELTAEETGDLGDFASRYPVEDDHSAALAIDTAIDEGLITGPGDWWVGVDLLANLDGELDSYRILVRPPGVADWALTSEMLCVMPGTVPDTMTVLREAVAAANDLLAAWATART